MNVKALVLAGYGINCEVETRVAFERAGADARIIHLGDLIESPEYLRSHHILAVPGGFSFGDDVASGRILANRLRYRLGEPLQEFIRDRKLLIGICNGFQVLVKMGLLPLFGDEFAQETTLTHNDSGRFEDRWVRLAVQPATRCVWVRGISTLELPVRHGEGKFLTRTESVLERLRAGGQIALRYSAADGTPAKGAYPANPNGSLDDIAGICDPSGRIFGLMPHPEAFLDGTNHPRWTREGLLPEGAGLAIFRNGVAHAVKHLIGGAAPARR
jgi:phosphoribosylformylglycinamidine synthase